jgi:hypothetical protein
MLPLVGSLVMGFFSGLIFWATISLGGARRQKDEMTSDELPSRA